jgi:small subunit ribosomal protein S17
MAQENNKLIREHVQKEMTGIVTSAKPDKTIVIRVARLAVHSVFKKTITRYSKFKAHDEKNEAKTGDTVIVKEARPISKNKCWRLIKVVKRAGE